MERIMMSNSSTRQTRREFGSSALGLAALVAGLPSVQAQQEPLANAVGESQSGLVEFAFGTVYTRQEAHRLLRPSKGLAPRTRVGLPFWWDKQAKLLVNPTNNTFDTSIKTGDYQLSATVLNFRASQRELGDVWKKLTNNAQLNINPASVSSEGDTLDWILMTGINVAQSIFSGRDGQLATLSQNNKPTNSLQKSEAVTFRKGKCSIGITINAQKKQSVWDRLLSAIKAFTGSTVFGILPIPKLYQTAIQSVTVALNQLQVQSKVIKVLGGNSYEYKLYEGANSHADLIFRPGHWVVLDSEFAEAHMDRNRNLSGIYLDVPGLLYQLKDSNNQLADTTYTVVDLDLSSVSFSHGESR